VTDLLPRTKHEDVLWALHAIIASDPFFPPPELDAPEPQNWRTAIPGAPAGMQDFCTVQDGEITVTRDGGAENSWELQLDAEVYYVVQSADRRARRAQRDAAQAHISALIRANRTLGLPDPQVYAEIDSVERDDEVPVKATAPVALVRVKLCIQFIAESPAG
jgi:hypothetical protein